MGKNLKKNVCVCVCVCACACVRACLCVCVYIYIYKLIHVVVHLKLTQHCKSTILQLKKKKRKIDSHPSSETGRGTNFNKQQLASRWLNPNH